MLNNYNIRIARKAGAFDRKRVWLPIISPGCFILLYLITIIAILVFLMFMPEKAYSVQMNGTVQTAWNDSQIVNAIYLAEGGKNAKYPYGIKSISCKSQETCRKICQNTVSNNRKRYSRLQGRGNQTYIEFLGSRYCPVKGVSLSNAERLLNKNWVKNVNWFLLHPKAKA